MLANPSLKLNKRVKMKCHTEEIKYQLCLNYLFLMTAPQERFVREWKKLDWSTALNIVHLQLNLTNWPVELTFRQNPLIFTPPDLYHFYKGHENSGLS